MLLGIRHIFGTLFGVGKKNETFFHYAELTENQHVKCATNIPVVMFSAKCTHKNNKTPKIQQYLYI